MHLLFFPTFFQHSMQNSLSSEKINAEINYCENYWKQIDLFPSQLFFEKTTFSLASN